MSDSLDEVRKALNKEKDPIKKAILARKARQLRGHGGLFTMPPKVAAEVTRRTQ